MSLLCSEFPNRFLIHSEYNPQSLTQALDTLLISFPWFSPSSPAFVLFCKPPSQAPFLGFLHLLSLCLGCLGNSLTSFRSLLQCHFRKISINLSKLAAPTSVPLHPFSLSTQPCHTHSRFLLQVLVILYLRAALAQELCSSLHRRADQPWPRDSLQPKPDGSW